MKPGVTLLDYGAGNLHSLAKALELGGAAVRVTSHWDDALDADALVLPGVGAFSAAVQALPEDRGPIRAALTGGLPCLGICLGMQLFFDGSDEGEGAGIGLIPGRVRRLNAPVVPHMGWNDVEVSDDPVFAGLGNNWPVLLRTLVPVRSSGRSLRDRLDRVRRCPLRRGSATGSDVGCSIPPREELAARPAAARKLPADAGPMIALPAVDLRGGRCVQLVGGRPEEEKISLPGPSSLAFRWWETGFKYLHLVDLDAALGHGNNDTVVREVLAATPAGTQVGGGVRTTERSDLLLTCGARRVVVGTRAVDDPDWIAALAKHNPGRILVAADVRERTVLRAGWTQASKIRVEVFLEGLSELPLAGVLCTDVDREGRMEGIDLAKMSAMIGASRHPVQVSGGITSLDDLHALADVGAAAAVLGMALYTGRLDPGEVAAKYGGMA